MTALGKSKHGHTAGGRWHPNYSRWKAMKKRCENPRHPSYDNYGGRGIQVCERWQRYSNFLEDMGLPPFEGAELDRIDNDGNYEPGNCRWATITENARNKRGSRHVTWNGRTQTVFAWAEELNIRPRTLWMRLFSHGWSIERALTEGVRCRNR